MILQLIHHGEIDIATDCLDSNQDNLPLFTPGPALSQIMSRFSYATVPTGYTSPLNETDITGDYTIVLSRFSRTGSMKSPYSIAYKNWLSASGKDLFHRSHYQI